MWDLESHGRLLVPDSYEYQDDSELISEAIRKLATYEQREVQEVILDISDPLVDTQYFRTHPDAPPGIISLPSGLRVVSGVHALLRTAARTTESGPQLLYEGRRSRPVDTFLHRVMLGSARPGSYILTARVPVPPPPEPQLDLWGREEADRHGDALGGREVMLTLNDTVRAAHAAATRVTSGQARPDAFDDYVTQGVSANLCKALADLGGYSRDRPVEIGFSWARGRPSPQPDSPIAFTAAMVTVLARAGEDLERLAKSGQAQITGQVETLNLTPGEQPRIKIVGELRTEAQQPITRRALWVIVSRVQYDQAIAAQREGWRVQAEGEVITLHGRPEMRPASFAILRG